MPIKISAGTPLQRLFCQRIDTNYVGYVYEKQVTITERSNAPPGERIRAVGMCFHGRGHDLTTGNLYLLKHLLLFYVSLPISILIDKFT